MWETYHIVVYDIYNDVTKIMELLAPREDWKPIELYLVLFLEFFFQDCKVIQKCLTVIKGPWRLQWFGRGMPTMHNSCYGPADEAEELTWYTSKRGSKVHPISLRTRLKNSPDIPANEAGSCAIFLGWFYELRYSPYNGYAFMIK